MLTAEDHAHASVGHGTRDPTHPATKNIKSTSRLEKPMIDVCHVQVLPILSGVQRAMLEMFRHLDRTRYQPHVICQQPGPLTVELAALDIPCHYAPSLDRPIRPAADARAYRELSALFRRHRFPLVHTHSSKPGVLARIAARRAGVPWVVHHVHSFAFHEQSSVAAHWLFSRLETLAGHYCDRVIFVNHEERELAVREGILPAEKCLTLHNGIDLRPYTPERRAQCRAAFRARHGLGPDDVAILFLGRLERQKQPLILPEIAARLAAFAPQRNWKLLVAGDGPLTGPLARMIKQRGLEQRVSLLGWQDEPQNVLHAADILLQPSLWEGLPISMIEGHAAGLPTVASHIRGIREVVTPQTGFLCPAREAATYAAALAALIQHTDLRQRLAEAARRRAFEAFDGTANLGQVARLYDEWLSPRAAAPHRRIAA
jgi:glycosyltransferase involved in cell wall biosynthesis